MNNQTNQQPSDEPPSPIGSQFLLTDFQFLGSYVQESIRLADKRADVLLTIVTTVIGALLLLFASDRLDILIVLPLASCSSFFLCLFGWNVQRQVLLVNVYGGEYVRALNRIRRYFTDHVDQIRDYTLMPNEHLFPPYDWKSSSLRTIAAINSVSCALLVISVIAYIVITFNLLPWSGSQLVGMAAAVTFLLIILINRIINILLKRWLANADKTSEQVRSSIPLLASHIKVVSEIARNVNW